MQPHEHFRGVCRGRDRFAKRDGKVFPLKAAFTYLSTSFCQASRSTLPAAQGKSPGGILVSLCHSYPTSTPSTSPVGSAGRRHTDPDHLSAPHAPSGPVTAASPHGHAPASSLAPCSASHSGPVLFWMARWWPFIQEPDRTVGLEFGSAHPAQSSTVFLHVAP